MVATEHNLCHFLKIMKAQIILVARYTEMLATRRQEIVKFLK